MHNQSGSRHERWLALAAAGIVVALTHSSAAAAPAWCSKAHKISDSDASSGLRDLKDGRPHYMLRALVDVTCHPTPEIEQNAAAIDKARVAWGAKLGLTTDADWADAAEWTTGDPTTQGMVQDDLSTKDIAKLTPIDQYLIAETDSAFAINSFYAADMVEPHLTEVGRFAVIEECVRVSNPSASNVNQIVACQPDIEAFDVTKFFAQLRTDTAHLANSRIVLRIRVLEIAEQLAKRKTTVEKLKKLDDAYAKAFEIAAAARPAWQKAVGTNAALIATVQQAETAHFSESRKALDACDAPTHAALTAAAAKFDLSKLRGTKDAKGNLVSGFVQEQLSTLLDDPDLNLAAIGVAVCARRDALGGALSAGMHTSYRGPRSLAYAMIAKAHLTPDKKDDRQDRLQIGAGYGSLEDQPSTDGRPWNTNANTFSSGGVIKSVKKTATALEIEFTPIWIKYQGCVAGHYTNKIDRIEPDGRVTYQFECTGTETAQVDDSEKGLKLDLELAGIVKPGVRVALVRGKSSGGENGPNADLVALWASASQVKPSWLFGAVHK